MVFEGDFKGDFKGQFNVPNFLIPFFHRALQELPAFSMAVPHRRSDVENLLLAI